MKSRNTRDALAITAAEDSANTPAERPTLATVCPEWKELSDYVGTLAWRRDEILAEMQENGWLIDQKNIVIFNEAHYKPSAVYQPPAPPKPMRQSLLEKLGRFAPPQPPEPDPNAPKPEVKVIYDDPHMARNVELAKELGDIEDALAILQPRLQRARAEGSKHLAEAVAPDYGRIATEVIESAIALAGALHRHSEFLANVQRGGAEPAFLRPIDPASVRGVLDDPRQQNPLRAMISWAVAQGHYAGSIPDWWNEPIPEPLPAPKRPAPAKMHPVKLLTTAKGLKYTPAYSERDTAAKERAAQIMVRVRGARAAAADTEAATIEPGG